MILSADEAKSLTYRIKDLLGGQHFILITEGEKEGDLYTLSDIPGEVCMNIFQKLANPGSVKFDN